MYAAYVGHDTIVNLLLDSDADPSLGTPTNLTPLMVAAGCGNESVCYFLIQVRGRERERESRVRYIYHSSHPSTSCTSRLMLKSMLKIRMVSLHCSMPWGRVTRLLSNSCWRLEQISLSRKFMHESIWNSLACPQATPIISVSNVVNVGGAWGRGYKVSMHNVCTCSSVYEILNYT